MDDRKYSKSITMVCSTCGSGDFEHEDEDGSYRCVSCDRVFTREELMRENSHIIDASVDQTGAEMLKDAAKETTSILRRTFSGSKNIRFK